MAGCQENPTHTKRNVRNMTTAIGREEAESEPGKFDELTPLKLLAGSERRGFVSVK